MTMMYSILASLWQGNFGLSKTFWIFGFLGGLFLGLISKIIGLEPGTPTTIAWVLIVIVHYVLFSGATWNAANHYNGHKIWRLVAKIFIVFTSVLLVAPVAYTVLNGAAKSADLFRNNDTNEFGTKTCYLFWDGIRLQVGQAPNGKYMTHRIEYRDVNVLEIATPKKLSENLSLDEFRQWFGPHANEALQLCNWLN